MRQHGLSSSLAHKRLSFTVRFQLVPVINLGFEDEITKTKQRRRAHRVVIHQWLFLRSRKLIENSGNRS